MEYKTLLNEDNEVLAPMARRKPLPPIPKGDPKGMFVNTPEGEIFVTFEELQQVCSDVMHPMNAFAVRQELGKMDWRDDPTYHMKKQRKRL